MSLYETLYGREVEVLIPLMSTPPPLPMKRRIKRVAPLHAATISAAFYALIGLVAIPYYLFITYWAHRHPGHAGAPPPKLVAGAVVLLFPVLYAAVGWLFGFVAAVIYNLIARMVGGLKIEIE
jgi:hypothetical protein